MRYSSLFWGIGGKCEGLFHIGAVGWWGRGAGTGGGGEGGIWGGRGKGKGEEWRSIFETRKNKVSG